jgi:hypothetical protein
MGESGDVCVSERGDAMSGHGRLSLFMSVLGFLEGLP